MGEVNACQHGQEHVHLCLEMEFDLLRERTLAHFSASSLPAGVSSSFLASQSCDQELAAAFCGNDSCVT